MATQHTIKHVCMKTHMHFWSTTFLIYVSWNAFEIFEQNGNRYLMLTRMNALCIFLPLHWESIGNWCAFNHIIYSYVAALLHQKWNATRKQIVPAMRKTKRKRFVVFVTLIQHAVLFGLYWRVISKQFPVENRIAHKSNAKSDEFLKMFTLPRK